VSIIVLFSLYSIYQMLGIFKGKGIITGNLQVGEYWNITTSLRKTLLIRNSNVTTLELDTIDTPTPTPTPEYFDPYPTPTPFPIAETPTETITITPSQNSQLTGFLLQESTGDSIFYSAVYDNGSQQRFQVDRICTHQGGILSWHNGSEGDIITDTPILKCSLHGAEFNATTGENTLGPFNGTAYLPSLSVQSTLSRRKNLRNLPIKPCADCTCGLK
jgi:nitrite reductase/ring-hydroxylating ferredoxin subunit